MEHGRCPELACFATAPETAGIFGGSAIASEVAVSAINLAAITAAICTGPEAHADIRKRYLAGISTGVFYLLLGIFGGTIAALFATFPNEFVLALAGFALLSTIGNSLYTAVADESFREAAVITFIVTASGVNLFGIGAAFWGLISGILVILALQGRQN